MCAEGTYSCDAFTVCYFILPGTLAATVKAAGFLRTELTGPIQVQQVTLHLRPDTRVGLHSTTRYYLPGFKPKL
jgi:precorrin-4 methylase